MQNRDPARSGMRTGEEAPRREPEFALARLRQRSGVAGAGFEIGFHRPCSHSRQSTTRRRELECLKQSSLRLSFGELRIVRIGDAR